MQKTNAFSEFPDVLSVLDLQKALGIGRSMAYRLIKSKKIKHLRIGRIIKIPKLSLMDYVEESCYIDCRSSGLSICQRMGGKL